MSYTIRHQVFVSSTFTDLKDERAEVIQAIWELDGIPTGMEAFVASNESQWAMIKRVIDECDYYVLIIGGRYGSTTPDGISYTEQEYRYAKSLGIPILAFVHGEPEAIPVGKVDTDAVRSKSLEEFRSRVMGEYPVRTWTTASELGGLVSRSLIKEIRLSPRPGWIRNDGSSPLALLEQVSKLTEENRKFRERLGDIDNQPDDNTLESGDDEFEITGHRTATGQGIRYQESFTWSTTVSWNDLFRDIGPALINEASEGDLKAILARFAGWAEPLPSGQVQVGLSTLSPESWNEIITQFRALGYVAPGVRKRGVNDKSSYWAITRKGDAQLLSLLARRR